VVAGDSLLKITANERIQAEFLDLCSGATSVLCCRVSPKQKAEVVMMIRKEHPGVTTLAIGDGANDVNMITSAHVGVGISGLEGQQATRASDFSIGQFRFLKNLMFVHGRECYRRNSYLIAYNFYKNVVFVFPLFFFGFFSLFSGTSFYSPTLYDQYNIFFTSIPIMWFGIFDFEFAKKQFLDNYNHYKIGFQDEEFNKFVFWRWITYAVI